jgi:hypothetical protein
MLLFWSFLCLLPSFLQHRFRHLVHEEQLARCGAHKRSCCTLAHPTTRGEERHRAPVAGVLRVCSMRDTHCALARGRLLLAAAGKVLRMFSPRAACSERQEDTRGQPAPEVDAVAHSRSVARLVAAPLSQFEASRALRRVRLSGRETRRALQRPAYCRARNEPLDERTARQERSAKRIRT